MDKECRNKADSSQYQAKRVNQFAVFKRRQYCSPDYRADCLYGKEDAYPIAGVLVFGVLSTKEVTPSFTISTEGVPNTLAATVPLV